MATKSKSTDTFKGLISWLSMLLLMCVTVTILGFLVTSMFIPSVQSWLAWAIKDAITALDISEPRMVAQDAVRLPILCGIVLFLVALLFTFLFRQDRIELENRIAGLLGKIWVEIKLALIALMMFLIVAATHMGFFPGFPLMLCVPLLTLYFLCLDIGRNRKFFSHNIIHSLLIRLTNYQGMAAFQRRSIRRVYACLGVIVGILALGVLILAALNDFLFYRPLFLFGFGASVVGAVVGTIWWYILALKQDLRDWNALLDQIAEMYGGNMAAVNHVPPTSNLYDCAMQLNMIRIGIQKAVEEGVKADRTKVELITNVSHDIKTPLTSIISYIELLKKEPGLPPHVMDYVNTISAKADRLSHIVQDVFEVSKAATGNINLDLEDLDLGKLLHQTFGEMEETLMASHLTWRVDIPDTPILVHADGQRLYRVFQNLIRNCAQYSLEGSRAYVKLSAQEDTVLVSIRNVSKNELTLAGDDLTARFVRGDQNRTTEGSGLGLSIAKSFTEACGGQLAVHTDGDLFTVTVRFPRVSAPVVLDLEPPELSLENPAPPVPGPAATEPPALEIPTPPAGPETPSGTTPPNAEAAAFGGVFS